MKITTLASLLVLVTVSNLRADGTLSAAPAQPRYARLAKDTMIARFRLTAIDEDLTLKQVAFGVTVSGTWINEQVTNVRLYDENHNLIAGPEKIWSPSIFCDCDSGRLFFQTVTNFVVKAGLSRDFTVFADFHTGISLSPPSTVIVTYDYADSRVAAERPPYTVNFALSPVNNVGPDRFRGVLIETPLAASEYARIDSFHILRETGAPDSLALFGSVAQHSTYWVEASRDLLNWEVIGRTSDSGPYDILKEVVGVVSNKYADGAFFRLRKIQL